MTEAVVLSATSQMKDLATDGNIIRKWFHNTPTQAYTVFGGLLGVD